VKVIERLTASGIWRNSIRLKPLFYRFLGGSVDIEQIDRGDRTVRVYPEIDSASLS